MSAEDQRLFLRGTGRDAVIADLQRVVKLCGNHAEAADALEISGFTVSATLRGSIGIGEKLLTGLYGPRGCALPEAWQPAGAAGAAVADEGTDDAGAGDVIVEGTTLVGDRGPELVELAAARPEPASAAVQITVRPEALTVAASGEVIADAVRTALDHAPAEAARDDGGLPGGRVTPAEVRRFLHGGARRGGGFACDDPASAAAAPPLDWRPLALADFAARIAAADAEVARRAALLAEATAAREDLGTAHRMIRELAA